MNVLAVITPGLEDALCDELAELGFRARAVPGGAELDADHRGVFELNLHSRLAARVLVRVGEGTARSLDQLASLVRGLPWKPLVHPGQPVVVRATLRGGRIRNKVAAEKKVEHAIADALRGPRIPGRRPPREPIEIVLRVVEDRATLSVDASGEALHKRGWRKATAKAPLRENLAAAVLRLADWAPGTPLVDPMCGAGTFAIEAAGIALGHAPGSRRTFAFERWPSFDDRVWRKLIDEARGAGALDRSTPIVASDRDPGAVKASRSNAERAGVAGRIAVRHAALAELEPPASTGLLVINPPYGERIGASAGPARIYRTMGAELRARWAGWNVAVLLPGRRWLGSLGLGLEPVADFTNGGIKVCLAAGEIRG